MDNQGDKILSVDSRPLRDMGNSVGNTFDKSALRELGVVDDEGNAIDGVDARQVIYEDGRIELTLNTPTENDRASD
jgi:hypothetical protein